MDEALIRLEQALGVAQEVIDGVRPDQLGNPTPDTDWDVRAVINHMIIGNLAAAANAGVGEPPDRSRDYAGNDYQDAFRRSGQTVIAAFGNSGALDRMYRMPFGEVPGRAVANMRANEALAHGWDIAQATGQPTDRAPELYEAALEGYRQRFGEGERSPNIPFAAEQPAPANASPADRLAAYLGRRVT